MRKQSITKQPDLRSPLLIGEDPTLRQFGEALRKEYGVGRVLQSTDGSLTATRYDPASGTIQVYRENKWQPIGVAPSVITETVREIVQSAGGGSALAYYQEGNNSALIDAPLTLSDTLTIPALTSELLKVNAGGQLQEAIEGTDYAGIDYANIFTAAQSVKLNSTAALTVKKADGTDVVVVDTTNSELEVTGAILVTGTVDAVDVAAHDHSTGTAQTRLAAKDRWRTISWHVQDTSLAQVANICYWFGDGTAGTGYVFPYAVHLTRLRFCAYASFTIPADYIDLAVYNNGSVIGSVRLTETGAGWYSGTTDISGQALSVINDLANEPINMLMAPAGGIAWIEATAMLEYTVD